MRKITLIISFILFSLVGNATFYVVPGGTGSADGSSWTNAYGDIQTAINAASTLYVSTSTAQEVWVKAGTYSTSSAAIIMKESVSLYGGFDGTETDKTLRAKGANAWDYTNVTTLNGGAAKRCIESGAGNYVNVTIIDGFTITNGVGQGAQTAGAGGGAFLRNNLKLQNCIVTGNTATGNGGGVNMLGGIVSNCWIYNNGGGNGGGMYSNPGTGTTTTIDNCLIERNTAATGGGLRAQGAVTTNVDRCNIRNNYTSANGAGMYIQGTTGANVTNCLITNNTGTNAVYLISAKLINSTIANNEGGVYLASASTGELYNNIIVNNVTKGTTSALGVSVATGYAAGKVKNNATWPSVAYQAWGGATDSILTTNAATALSQVAFKSPVSFRGRVLSNADSLTAISSADWRLKDGTYCLSKGDNTLIPAGISYDYAGNSRILNTTVETGVYEYVKTQPTITWTQNLTELLTTDSPVALTASSSAGANGATITYASDNTSVVTVSGSTLTVAGVGTATVTASQADNSWFTAATNVPQSVVVVNGSVTVAGYQNASDLTLSAGTEITVNSGGMLTVNTPTSVKSITVAAGGKMTNTSTLNITTLTLNSDATGTATFVDNGNSAINAVVKQYLTAGRNWYMSIPVTSVDSSAMSSANAIVCYNEPTASWISPESATLSPLRGYISASTKATGSISFNGTLNTGDKSIVLTRTASVAKSGFNLLGNPYPSYLDWSLASVANPGVMSTIWYRTKNASVYIFDTYNAVGNVHTNNGLATVSNLIPPMQAFWVRVNEGQPTATVTFTNAMRSHADVSGNRMKSPAMQQTTQQVLRIQVSNGVNSDETIVLFNSNATNGIDNFDSPKMTNNNATIPELYTVAGNQQLVINGLNSITPNGEIVLGFITGQSNAFTLKATEISNFDSAIQIVLKDKLLNSEQPLIVGFDYSFTSDVTSDTNRFSLIFKSSSLTTGLSENNVSSNILVNANTNQQISISHLSTPGSADCAEVYNSVGQQLHKQQLINSMTLINRRFDPGVYIVVLYVHGEKKIQKLTIK